MCLKFAKDDFPRSAVWLENWSVGSLTGNLGGILSGDGLVLGSWGPGSNGIITWVSSPELRELGEKMTGIDCIHIPEMGVSRWMVCNGKSSQNKTK